MSANYMQSTKSVSVSQLVHFISLNTRFYCQGNFEYFLQVYRRSSLARLRSITVEITDIFANFQEFVKRLIYAKKNYKFLMIVS